MKSKLHPGARWIFRFRAYWVLLFLSIFFTFGIIRAVFGILQTKDIAGLFLTGFLIYILSIFFFGEIYARMSYNRWLYEFTHEGLKIEHGIIWKKYTSIPYERVQNVDIRRGILARLFNFSTLEIETAGQSGMAGYYRFRRRGYKRYKSEGHLPAVDISEAEKIREFVMKMVRHTHKDNSGL